MPEIKKTLIMKFGGASVQHPENFSALADLILRRSEEYSNIVAVVSAMGGMTDELISLAKKVNPAPPKREYDMLVSAGERISISLLTMALAAKGKGAVSFTGSQSGIVTSDEHSNAEIVAVRPERLLPHLDVGEVVVVAGFQGVSARKEITTLGRGGSDTTAVALGAALGAEKVEFYKDVKGVFEHDPSHVPDASCFRALDYVEALQVIERTGGRLLHRRALLLAQHHRLPLHIRSFKAPEEGGTVIA